MFDMISALVVFFSYEEGFVNVKPRFLLGYWKILIRLRQNTVRSHLDYWYQTDFLYWKKNSEFKLEQTQERSSRTFNGMVKKSFDRRLQEHGSVWLTKRKIQRGYDYFLEIHLGVNSK